MISAIDKHLARLEKVGERSRAYRQSKEGTRKVFSPLTSGQKKLAQQYIPEEIRAGFPRSQAIAIGLSRARRGK